MKYYIKIENTYSEKIDEKDLLDSNNNILRTYFMNKHNDENPYAKRIEKVSKKNVKYYEI